MRIVRSAQRFQASRAGKIIAWLTVVTVASVAVRSFAGLMLRRLGSQPLNLTDAVLLGLGLFCIYGARAVYLALIQPTRHVGRS